MIPSAPSMLIVARNTLQIEFEMRQYGWEGMWPPPTVYNVFTPLDANAAILSVPANIAWCSLDGADETAKQLIRKWLFNEKTFAEAFAMLNDEYAIHPKRLAWRPQNDTDGR